MNLDTCRCMNDGCILRDTCQRWTTRDEHPGMLKRYTIYEPEEGGTCKDRIPLD